MGGRGILGKEAARSDPMSARTDTHNGMPMMAKSMQNTRPPIVSGAILPYPETHKWLTDFRNDY